MPPIVDGHAHIFPPLGEASGFESAELHLLFQQWAMHTHGNQPVRRRRDHALVTERHLWAADDPSERGRATDLDFRVGRFGRFEWTKDGEDYYVQFLSPNLQDMTSPAEFMITQMDYVGIDTAILQNDHIYGNSALDFAEAAARFPGRFIGLAQVEEAFAYRDDQMAILVDSIDRLGMHGLYFTMSGFFRNGFQVYYTDPEFRPFWDQVTRLGIPVFWVFPTSSPKGSFVDEMRRFRGWLERHSEIRSVITHGLPTALFADDDDRITFPEEVSTVIDHFPVSTEILYPIGCGGRFEYPYKQALHHARQVYDRFGAGRLIWGSDMPNVERYCTYAQSLTYLRDHADFLTAEDRAGIFGQNALALFDHGRT